MRRGSRIRRVTVTSIMRSHAFRAGVADVRAGRPARFDDYPGFDYECGRQWAVCAPRTMLLFIGRCLNSAPRPRRRRGDTR